MLVMTEQDMWSWNERLIWLKTSLWIIEQLKQRLRISLQWDFLLGARQYGVMCGQRGMNMCVLTPTFVKR